MRYFALLINVIFIMEQDSKISSRKKFLLWGAAVLSSLTVLKFIPAKEEEEKKETVKMLTQDGRLVEVDISKRVYGKREHIDDEKLKKWVSKK
jgi:hypothetical protein